MGRPRGHDEQTGEALLRAAERIVEAEGAEALSVRRVAEEVGTTTRAVYSVFGSKEGLVTALGRRAFELLGSGVEAVPHTGDPAADLVEAGVTVFRRFAVEHPSLFRIGIQRAGTSPEVAAGFYDTASEALAGLYALVARLEPAGLLGRRTVRDAMFEFHALCEGLAAVELRGLIEGDRAEHVWRDALTALVRGFAVAVEG